MKEIDDFLENEDKPTADIDSIMEWLNKRAIEGDNNLFSTRAIAGLIQGFIAQWVLPTPNAKISDDLIQYVTNLLYSSFDQGLQVRKVKKEKTFDKWVEEQTKLLSLYFDSIDEYERKVPIITEDVPKTLIEKAEMFIIKNDEYAKVIKDGQIKNGAQLLADFYMELL